MVSGSVDISAVWPSSLSVGPGFPIQPFESHCHEHSVAHSGSVGGSPEAVFCCLHDSPAAITGGSPEEVAGRFLSRRETYLYRQASRPHCHYHSKHTTPPSRPQLLRPVLFTSPTSTPLSRLGTVRTTRSPTSSSHLVPHLGDKTTVPFSVSGRTTPTTMRRGGQRTALFPRLLLSQLRQFRQQGKRGCRTL